MLDTYSPSGIPTRLLPRPGPMDAKDKVEMYAGAAIRSVDTMAQKDTTGPEANYQRSVRGLADHAKQDIAALQAQANALPAGSPARAAIEQKIEARGDQFQRELQGETRYGEGQIKAKRGGQEGKKFVDRLPPYLQQCVKNEGVAIPGTNIGIKPRFDNGGIGGGPTGATATLRF